MSSNPEVEFLHQVAQAMAGCQELELRLKRHIYESYAHVRKVLKGEMPFKFGLDSKEVEKKSLGQLIETFAKLTDNDILVKKLRAFVEERNFIAHKAITGCIIDGEHFCQTRAGDLQQRLEKIQKEVWTLANEVDYAIALVSLLEFPSSDDEGNEIPKT